MYVVKTTFKNKNKNNTQLTWRFRKHESTNQNIHITTSLFSVPSASASATTNNKVCWIIRCWTVLARRRDVVCWLVSYRNSINFSSIDIELRFTLFSALWYSLRLRSFVVVLLRVDISNFE